MTKRRKSTTVRRPLVAIAIAVCLAGAAAAQDFNLATPREGAPVRHADGTMVFQLLPGECAEAEYYSGRLLTRTSDCDRQRNRIEFSERSTAGAGDRRLYEWDIFIPSDFSYNASGGHLIAGQFHNQNDLLYSFALSNSGYTFRGQDCVGPESFGAWHTVSVRVQYDTTRRQTLRDQTPGILVVECDGEVVVDASGRPNLSVGDEVTFRYGLYGAMNFPDTDNVSVSFRNVRISGW